MAYAAVQTPPRASSSTFPKRPPPADSFEPVDQDEDMGPTKLTFASREIKELSFLRTSDSLADRIRPADVGQALQVRLAADPPRIHPEFEARRLIDFFQAYVQEWEQGHSGLAVINIFSSSISEVIPPWDYAWTDDYLIDPSLPHVSNIQPLPPINGHKLTDELIACGGCDCPDDECDPRTCACLRRANDCYPYAESHYQRMFANAEQSAHNRDSVDMFMTRTHGPKFVYDANGRIQSDVPEGTPIFECNKDCSCSSACKNRVVQKGKKVKLAFWRTQDKGWGIKTLEALPKGTFVGAYGGELISDAEAERRAQVYEERLGTTYLQVVDNHIIKIHLVRQMLEEKLALEDKLDDYRGSAANARRMVERISTVADQIETYEEYYAHIERGADRELFEAERRKREGAPGRSDDEHVFARAKNEAYRRARQQAERRRERERERTLRPNQEWPELTDMDLDDAVWNFLSWPAAELDEIREAAVRRSAMDDERFVTVDSALLGNHTRFFNHSCDPNLLHYPVYVDDASILRPLLAFFTLRDVAQGEELCFSYAGVSGSTDVDSMPAPSPQSESPSRSRATMHAPTAKPGKQTLAAVTATAADAARATAKTARLNIKGSMKCACGAKNCTGRVFT